MYLCMYVCMYVCMYIYIYIYINTVIFIIACYATFTFSLKHRWTYFLRTLPDIQDRLEPLENAISNVLIPTITEHSCSSSERDMFALLVCHGGLGITNPCHEANSEY